MTVSLLRHNKTERQSRNRKLCQKRWVLKQKQKAGSHVANLSCFGRPLQMQAVVTRKAWLPMADSHVWWLISVPVLSHASTLCIYYNRATSNITVCKVWKMNIYNPREPFNSTLQQLCCAALTMNTAVTYSSFPVCPNTRRNNVAYPRKLIYSDKDSLPQKRGAISFASYRFIIGNSHERQYEMGLPGCYKLCYCIVNELCNVSRTPFTATFNRVHKQQTT